MMMTASSTSTSSSSSADFLVTDSLDLPDAERPSLAAALANPRDSLAIGVLLIGAAVALCNLLGNYADSTYLPLEGAAIALGFASAGAAAAQLAFGYNIRRAGRRGMVDDGIVTGYAGAYTFSVSWLAWRTSALCSDWLASDLADHLLAPFAIATFAFGVVVPIATLWGGGEGEDKDAEAAAGEGLLPGPPLSATELLRCQGLLAVGAIGAVFIPDCIAFLLGGQAWWGRVAADFGAQRTLESSTSLFALFATEASMVAHRCGKVGVAPYTRIVPAFVAVCVVLAVAPCVAALAWLGEDISFLSFYSK